LNTKQISGLQFQEKISCRYYEYLR